MLSSRKSWADQQGIPTGVFGETYKGIPITEETRATTWEFRREGIELLQKILRENYKSKGVPAVLFGVHFSPEELGYAVFVRKGFLVDVGEDE